MFIKTGVQKCELFPTHNTPLPPGWDTNSGKINLIGYRPSAGLTNTHIEAYPGHMLTPYTILVIYTIHQTELPAHKK